jgi:hypothetical protein
VGAREYVHREASAALVVAHIEGVMQRTASEGLAGFWIGAPWVERRQVGGAGTVVGAWAVTSERPWVTL